MEKWLKFWEWTTLWEHYRCSNWTYEKCICSCWTVRFVIRRHLLDWWSKSCWCSSYDYNKNNLEQWKRFWTRTCTWQYKHEYSWTRKVRYEYCICDCWTEKRVRRDHLLWWRSKNCWCLKWERIWKLWKERLTRHWLTWTRIHYIWLSILARCTNPNNASYDDYWWRWIKCERNIFEDFYNDMYESYEKHVTEFWEKDTTIDRIDVNWNYCKENCRWATNIEQQNNKRNNVKIIYNWREYISIACLCRELWLKRWLIQDRIRKQWRTVEDAVELPLIKWRASHDKIRKSIQPASPAT